MQTEADAERVEGLGAPSERVRICGNVKFDQPRPQPLVVDNGLARFIALSRTFLIVAGSTAPGEEEMMLNAFRKIRRQAGLEDVTLLIAPRHPERFAEIAELISQSEFKLIRRSDFSRDAVVAGDSNADVLLLDSIGELSTAYASASVVFIGGSLVPRGGHNVIEPAALAKPIITGPYTENFREVTRLFNQSKGIIQLEKSADLSDSLADQIIRLLENRIEAAAMGERARALVERNSGAVDRIVSEINRVVKKSSVQERSRLISK